MVRVLGEHALQRRHDRGALRVRFSPARLPVIPGTDVHQRFGVEHRDLVVLRKLHRSLGHGRGVGGIQFGTVRLGVLCVALGQGRDQRLLLRARLGGKRARSLRRSERGRHCLFYHRHVDVGAEHQRLSPEAHGTVGIELLRLAECALCLLVIEGMRQPQTLVEIALRGRARRGDLVCERAEAVPQRRIAIGERQRRRGGIAPGLRYFGLRCDQVDHAARHRSDGRRLAEREVPAELPHGIRHRNRGGGIGGDELGRFGGALAAQRKQYEAACARTGGRSQKRRPQSHDCFHDSSLQAGSPEVSSPVAMGIRQRAVPRSTCAPTA